jgi:hypothetical protein
MAGNKAIPVQNAGDEIVIGNQHQQFAEKPRSLGFSGGGFEVSGSDRDFRLVMGERPRCRCGVCLCGKQFRDSDQVVGDEVQQESCGDTGDAAVFCLVL